MPDGSDRHAADRIAPIRAAGAAADRSNLNPINGSRCQTAEWNRARVAEEAGAVPFIKGVCVRRAILSRKSAGQQDRRIVVSVKLNVMPELP